MDRDTLKENVRAKMDELAPDDQVSTHPISTHINKELDQAAIFILENAPLHLLDHTAIDGTDDSLSIHDASNKVNYVKVPDGFLRLACFMFSDWERPVHSFISQESNEYSLQANPFTKAGKAKPVVVQVIAKPPTQSSYGRWLMCGEVENADTGAQLHYIKSDVAEGLPDRLSEAIEWLTAARLFQIFGMGEKSQAAVQKYMEFMASKTV